MWSPGSTRPATGLQLRPAPSRPGRGCCCQLRGPANQADGRRHVSATARVEESWKSALLQRPGVPWRSQGPERLAEAASAKLERRWTYRGTDYKLTEGRYCWHVWPGYGKRSVHRYGKRLGVSCFPHRQLMFMRALAPIAVVLVAALAAPSASAQGGGVTPPHSGGVPCARPGPPARCTRARRGSRRGQRPGRAIAASSSSAERARYERAGHHSRGARCLTPIGGVSSRPVTPAHQA